MHRELNAFDMQFAEAQEARSVYNFKNKLNCV